MGVSPRSARPEATSPGRGGPVHERSQDGSPAAP